MPTILEYFEGHQVIIVSAAPGSGKSSVLPWCLARSGYGPVICAQPRHFAATVAAAKAGEEWERDVAFTTTRRLLGETRPPVVLAAFRAVVIDEAHDRVLGTARAAVAAGEMGRVRVVVCTADGPADEDALSGFFGGAPVVAFHRAAPNPVLVHYSRGPVLDMLSAVVDEVAEIHGSSTPGDVLAFLPDVVRVEEACHRLEQLGMPGLVVSRMHDHFPAEFMGDALDPAPSGCTKVVVATDVAETAVRVPGITYVVDPGVRSEEPFEMISREAARRRLGVAGDAGPGHCHRLYMQDNYTGFEEHNVPAIRRDGSWHAVQARAHAHETCRMPGFELLGPSGLPELDDVVGQLVDGGYLDKHTEPTEKAERKAYDED
ncbi:hypothetical protein PR202_ga26133 [Eleusine coracana subsp. coracana]|uniref:Helicase C-terminal domain-containing protein n=1 Tax=Eleusine coracana subsp. coracana TaxID=191504 RepID=A0AAV5DB40_ELECO|nr:hypothetical protein QOZ80_3AG0243680 [Eleusine coracana subsp. coracana]GJN08234.1 hypothetical protein PR202_ga26133 [Eleusine coracana subsp. coracana]